MCECGFIRVRCGGDSVEVNECTWGICRVMSVGASVKLDPHITGKEMNEGVLDRTNGRCQ